MYAKGVTFRYPPKKKREQIASVKSTLKNVSDKHGHLQTILHAIQRYKHK